MAKPKHKIDDLDRDKPTPEQFAKHHYERDYAVRGKRGEWERVRGVHRCDQDPLDRLKSHKQIDPILWEAGHKFRMLFEASGQYGESVVSSLMVTGGGRERFGTMPTTEREVNALRQWRAAYMALMDSAPYIQRFTTQFGFPEDRQYTAEQIGRELGCTGRTTAVKHGMVVIRHGLGVLAQHFGFIRG